MGLTAAEESAPVGEAGGGGGRGGSCRVCDWARDLMAAASRAAAPPGRGAGSAESGDSPSTRGTPAPAANGTLMAPPDASTRSGPPAGPTSSDAAGMRRADCLGCRITGLIAGLGSAGYLSSRLLEDPPPRGGHRATLLASSALLAGLGLARGFGWY
ncbi:hypothetical protein MNEG_9033 [Monoraphidium neglectum]|uniref:DUF4536 domain-containing protein n=1 Tax=Monoraphidium neglectum TaxID=145388 RepID=A0A0D2MXG3_9CHLO|nr:hypothetical protein MNEG_9033 [Monoraphidium neglectum]KIY98930.1 hypothetical protein MNEG_9033 [Monoraphidium neglectum]|eukprot:XP_013897950.1 hypothetical protein MNEG_9033 [Monoraphidium neglectum]